MRRTQAKQTAFAFDEPRLFATTACTRCGSLGITILVLGRNESGAIEVGYCDYPCAKAEGWPRFSGERPKLPSNPRPPAAAQSRTPQQGT
jgi:hypothetical protein